jgi:protocatechuate 3,4-dioxygenase beta subunit
VLCSIQSPTGTPIPDVKIDIWEADSSGHYDVQYASRAAPDGRAVMRSDAAGRFWFRAIRPVSYPIPHDGPVGRLLDRLCRHPWRPAHLHFMFAKPGWDHLVTALYIPPDPYMTSDAVFGVKASLITPLDEVSPDEAGLYDVPLGTKVLRHDFVLVTEEETVMLKDRNALEAVGRLFPGRKVKLLDHLPVLDVD